jgi:hypothetical protein
LFWSGHCSHSGSQRWILGLPATESRMPNQESVDSDRLYRYN